MKGKDSIWHKYLCCADHEFQNLNVDCNDENVKNGMKYCDMQFQLCRNYSLRIYCFQGLVFILNLGCNGKKSSEETDMRISFLVLIEEH
jgi:hypothetical protein